MTFKFNKQLDLYDLSEYRTQYGIHLVYEDAYDEDIQASKSIIKERMKELIDIGYSNEHFDVLQDCVKKLEDIDR